MIELDILIVGGGAQGLWLLNDLDRLGYRTILLERDELGGGQTCHSHALIHRGHYYDDAEMMILLNAAAQFWLGFLRRSGLEPINKQPSLVGFGPGCGVERFTYMWNLAGLTYNAVDPLPAFMEEGNAHYVFETEEFSIDASAVTSGLAHPVSHCLYKLDDSPDALAFECQKGSIQYVIASVGGRKVELKCKLLVLCAGESNLALLQKLGAHFDVEHSGRLVQARRKSTMLCLRSLNLPHITAVFPIEGGMSGLFICARTCPDTGKTVWLLSDHNSAPFNAGIGSDGDLDPTPKPLYIGRVLESLRGAMPRALCQDSWDDIEISVYTGLTSEREFGGGAHMTDCYIEPLGLDDVLTIWPTKLTLTPFSSNIAARIVRMNLPPPAEPDRKARRWPEVGMAELPPKRPKVAMETWRQPAFVKETAVKTEWRSFIDFCREFEIELGSS